MNITTRTLSKADLTSIVERVSHDEYDDNLTVEIEQIGPARYRFKLGAKDSYGNGTRTSWTGRHGRWACWHAFRDVLSATFLADPKAVIRTQMATYKGARDFLTKYPSTAQINIGSMMQPAYMDEQCECSNTFGPDIETLERKYL